MVSIGVVFGFMAFMLFWVGLAMWLRVDADKHGMTGWVWAFLGIIGGPAALFAYLIFRGNRPVLAIVNQRDVLIEETIRTGLPSDYNPGQPATTLNPGENGLSPETQAALEAEQRPFKY